MLLVSSMSFHTTESVQSADVVGSNFMELILYNPSASHTRLHATKISFGTWVSNSRFANVDSTFSRLVIGVRMAILVTEIEKMFRPFPDMYIINAFIRICCPGLVAMAIAFDLRFAKSCAVAIDELVVDDSFFRSAACRLEYPIEGGHLVRVW